ncbi:MAG: hypothetical protein AAFW83_06330 [Pseudomonadota bacterium]
MFTFFFNVLGLVTLAGGAFYYWVRRTHAQMRDAADYEWAFLQKNDPALIDHLEQPAFQKIFFRTHYPRFPVYAFACVATFLISLPVTLGLLALGMWGLDQHGLIVEPGDVTSQLRLDPDSLALITRSVSEVDLYQGMMHYVGALGGFYYFFGVLLMWLLIVFAFTRHYHKNRPGYLRDEIIRAR